MAPPIHVAQVVAGLAARYGGPSYSVPRLCRALAHQGDRCTLLTVADRGEPDRAEDIHGYHLRSFAWQAKAVPLLGRLRLSGGLARALAGFDVIHSHGLWLMPNVVAGRAARRWGGPLIVSPRGMLAAEALRFSALRKRLFWHVAQSRALPPAACLHATSDAEYEAIRAFGLRQPVAVIANGIDLEPGPRERGSSVAPNVLFLGRVHPMKGLLNLVRAWAAVEPENPEWRLRIIGPDEAGHADELRTAAHAAGLQRISIEPPVDGEAKREAYEAASVTILPSHNENFGLTVAESLTAGRPVIASRGTPWQGLDKEGCGWWVDNDPASLAAAMQAAMSLPEDERISMGKRGRAWMERDFGWAGVASKMSALYAWRLGRGEQPGFVRHD